MSADVSELAKTYPKDELYVLTTQLKRACDSISLNIAEASTSQSTAEFQKFLDYSIRSAVEVVTCFFLARKRKLIDDDVFKDYYEKLTELIKERQALRKALN